MDLNKTYQDILTSLKSGGRGQIKLTSLDYEELNSLLNQKRNLKEVLCILNSDIGHHQALTNSLLELMTHETDSNTLINLLMCIKHHHINGRAKLGERVQFEVLQKLESLLSHQDPEVVEWVLRVIEDMGSQGVYFAKTIKNLKPNKFSILFNKSKKNIYGIITILENKWGKYDSITK